MATSLFWLKGYEGTSLSPHLTDTLGITRLSLLLRGRIRNKEALVQACVLNATAKQVPTGPRLSNRRQPLNANPKLLEGAAYLHTAIR